MKLIGAVLVALTITACTPTEVQTWWWWHAQEPTAAEEWLVERLPPPTTTAAPRPEPERSEERSVWDRVAECESNGNWSINTGNGYYGGLQFSLQSWRAVGGEGYPHHASRSEQIRRAERLLDLQGWGAWPTCSRQLGLR